MKTKQASVSRRVASTLAFGMLALASSVAVSAEPEKNTAAVKESATADATVAPGHAAVVRAYIDPATGQLRAATPEELAEQARQTASADAVSGTDGKITGVQFITRENGMRGALDTQGRLMESVVATKNADGSLSIQYVTADGAEAHGAEQTPAPAQLEEK